jgi:hypothetical protein
VGIAWEERAGRRSGRAALWWGRLSPAPTGTLLAAPTIYDRLFGRDVRSIPLESLLKRLSIPLTAERVRALEAGAHLASDDLPDDPTIPFRWTRLSFLPEAAPADAAQYNGPPQLPKQQRTTETRIKRRLGWRPSPVVGILWCASDPGGYVLRGLRIVVPALLLIAPACAHSGGGEEVQPTGSPAYVEVVNRHALPMELYALGSGITQRLGTVYPGMTAHFTVPPNLIGNGSVRFEARPSGGGQPFRSGDLLLAPGATLDFVIAPQLFNSTVTRRP